MKTFNVGDLLRFKPASHAGNSELVLVLDKISGSSRHFYGHTCSTGDRHLWSYDQFYLVAASNASASDSRNASEAKNFGRKE
jgi:hypothetical protein|tara:strand:- start:579 stop:824 length:246 start_codon:yes stop_codon:yes gene_type:complete